MKNLLKLALIALAVYLGFAYYAGSQNALQIGAFGISPLPTWSYTPRGSVPDIGTPDPASINGHGVLEATWPVDPYGNQFYPLGYPNNTSYPLLQNNYPV